MPDERESPITDMVFMHILDMSFSMSFLCLCMVEKGMETYDCRSIRYRPAKKQTPLVVVRTKAAESDDKTERVSDNQIH